MRISIVIPAYNEERHLAACLTAIANQTLPPFEVIVVDNNSTDATAVIARSFPFVRLLHERQQGIVYARTKGFDAAKGDIIGRIDADTILPVTWAADVIHFYEQRQHANSALTGGGYFYNVRLPRINGWLQGQIAYRMNRFIVGHYILWGSNMALPAALWKHVRAAVCMDDAFHEDLDLAFHLHRRGYRITYRESLRVGVYFKRARQNLPELREHMQRWPRTLRVHGYRLWWMGVLGNVFLWWIALPSGFAAEAIARLFGRRPMH